MAGLRPTAWRFLHRECQPPGAYGSLTTPWVPTPRGGPSTSVAADLTNGYIKIYIYLYYTLKD